MFFDQLLRCVAQTVNLVHSTMRVLPPLYNQNMTLPWLICVRAAGYRQHSSRLFEGFAGPAQNALITLHCIKGNHFIERTNNVFNKSKGLPSLQS